jgi:hypothetical protein
VYSERQATAIGISWEKGSANGGSSILDYTVSYDQATGTYVVLESGILNKQYTATGLTPGQTYKFKV